MKILHLLYESTGDSFGIGGVGIRAYEIYSHLRARHDITLLCKKYPGARDGEIAGLRHIFAGAESNSLTRTLISYALHATRFVRHHGEEYDVIVEEFSPAIPTFLHAFTKKPLILQIQGYTGLLYFNKYNPLYALVLHGFENVRPRFYRHVIFVSDRTVARYSLKKDAHFRVIANGISDELLEGSPKDGDYILYLGRIDVYGKGLDLLLAAYQEFIRSFPHIRLRIAGDGRDMGRFRNLVAAMPDSVKRNVELLGWISGQEKKESLQNALFAVFPSRHEVQPISVLEAMASEKAVVVSDIPEFSFITELGGGASFTCGDSDALARSMKEMALSDMRRERGKRARQYMQERTWRNVAMAYEQFLHAVIGTGRKI